MRRKKKRRNVFGSFPPMPSMNLIFNSWRIPGIIKAEAKKEKQIIYGRQAMNKQLPGFLRATTYDYDIYTKSPKKTASNMQAKLDKEVAGGADHFFMKPAKHPGTYRVMSRGPDKRKGTEDDYEVADYTEPPARVSFVRLSGIRYERLSSIKKSKKRILKDPEATYRHEKDKGDLRRIEASKAFRR